MWYAGILLTFLNQFEFCIDYRNPPHFSCRDLDTRKRCIFSNLCYFDGKFVLRGAKSEKIGPINISGVPNHTAMTLNLETNISSLPVDLKFQPGTTLLMRRFLPSNLMHVLHDDLLPLFATLNQLLASGPVDTVVFDDFYTDGPYWLLYDAVLQHFGVKVAKLTEEKCFEKVMTGLSNQTVWYQYGFEIPQGAVQPKNFNKTSISEFSAVIREFSNISERKRGSKIVLLSRKENRLILNERELVMALISLGMQVTVASFETHSLPQLITVVSDAQVLIAMHGSILALSMFLPPNSNSLIVELFPYAVNPANYTPYRTLAQRLGLRYISWRNMKIQNTVTHPENPRELGGIAHLSKKDQDKIIKCDEIEVHLCCENPYWLFRIYQDTVVDVQELYALIKDNL